MTPLMSGFEMNHAGGMEVMNGNGNGIGIVAPSDPVELRRLNFQTPGNLCIAYKQHIFEFKKFDSFRNDVSSTHPSSRFSQPH